MYSYKTHYTLEKIKRRLIYRCKKGYYTSTGFVVSDGSLEWSSLMDRLLPSFEIVYPDYAREYYFAYKEEKRISARRYRYFKYLKKMLDNIDEGETLVWLTLTFSEDYIQNDFSTLKKYCRDYLNLVCTNWIACEDYGSKNHRLHFHCICVLSRLSSFRLTFEKVRSKQYIRIFPAWGYGFADCAMIKKGEERKRLDYAMSFLSYGRKAKDGFEGYKPFHNRNFIYKMQDIDSGCDFEF